MLWGSCPVSWLHVAGVARHPVPAQRGVPRELPRCRLGGQRGAGALRLRGDAQWGPELQERGAAESAGGVSAAGVPPPQGLLKACVALLGFFFLEFAPGGAGGAQCRVPWSNLMPFLSQVRGVVASAVAGNRVRRLHPQQLRCPSRLAGDRGVSPSLGGTSRPRVVPCSPTAAAPAPAPSPAPRQP